MKRAKQCRLTWRRSCACTRPCHTHSANALYTFELVLPFWFDKYTITRFYFCFPFHQQFSMRVVGCGHMHIIADKAKCVIRGWNAKLILVFCVRLLCDFGANGENDQRYIKCVPHARSFFENLMFKTFGTCGMRQETTLNAEWRSSLYVGYGHYWLLKFNYDKFELRAVIVYGRIKPFKIDFCMRLSKKTGLQIIWNIYF